MIVTRLAQPYVAIRCVVTMQTMSVAADRIPDVLGWAADRGVVPSGAPFFRYLVIDMEADVEIEVGVPVDRGVDGDGEVTAGVLPGGRYAVVEVTGHPDRLVEATADLLDRARDDGLVWDRVDTDRGEAWGCRLEVYPTDPREEPDMDRWRTELVFRLAD